MKAAFARMNRLMMILILLVVGIAVTQRGEAATIVAANCTSGAVQAAINTAVNGDTVSIPAGDCTWTTTVTSNKGITLQGAGQGITILRDSVSKGGGTCSGGGPLMSWGVNSPNTFRMTGLTIVGVASDPGVCQRGHLTVSGSAKTMRIDHITISPAQTVAIYIFGDVWGLIDHLTFSASFKNAIRVEHLGWNGTSGDNWGDQSWAQALNWGANQGIFIEDSIFTDTSGGNLVGNFTDCFSGGRMVIRHNTFNAGNLTSHGADSDQRHRGCRAQEVYNNLFVFTASQTPAFTIWVRGGSGVVFNNTITAPGGLNKVVQASNCRDADAGCGGGPSYTPWGACNGSSPYDQNASGGYRCVDQPGAGTSNLISGNPPSPVARVGNIGDPIYVWNNTSNGSSNNTTSGSNNVQGNRDYFVGTPRPGYSAFTYPHPLQAGGGAGPSGPTNLQLGQGSMTPGEIGSFASALVAETSRSTWDDLESGVY